ncbi:MAG: 6,7-dimethyl-8-ribityllumazine synthase [Verrucomicrobia bacterium]|jgi:6,7-dimethyl-8-ribityllumazine synthase|nr:6,7-dimethyl-8-ribityllumazine synthase [Verrucomicrobiota bacterium]
MLQPVTRHPRRASGGRFAIVASEYNGRYVGAMLRAARAELLAAEVAELKIIRVPGAFEIPAVAARLARLTSPGFDAIICLGVILRGQTTHAEHIGTGVTNALIQLQVETGKPLIHEVLLLENEEQARARCLSKEHNRGAEAAQTALAMAAVMRRLPREPSDNEVPF